MRDLNPSLEKAFFDLFQDYYNTESSVAVQHDPATYTLARMTPLAELAGHPERKLKVVHIAGTKGKGSTSHFTANLLLAAGHTAGLFTSPHLSTVRERFEINGELISYEELIGQSKDLLDKIHQNDLKPSLFEIFTVLALKIFADNHLEYAVMETGIGGLLDATNYIPSPACSAITSISFDHTALLGKTIPEIASQKAGIIKPGIPVVISVQPYQEADDTIVAQATKLHAPVVRPIPAEDCAAFVKPTWAPFLKENFRTAMAVLKTLGLTPDASRFTFPRLRARCERICDTPIVVLDGAHNADSIKHAVDAIKLLYPTTAFTVVLGSVQGKDIDGIAREIALLHAPIILTNPHTPKQSALEQLKLAAVKYNLNIVQVIESLTTREQLPANTPLLFTGSFFTATIGEELFN